MHMNRFREKLTNTGATNVNLVIVTSPDTVAMV